MNCPRDNTALVIDHIQDVEVDRCPQCQGMWLDYAELDAIEDKVMTDDHAKGTMVWNPVQSELKCPVCGETMNTFDYRLERLMLDVCPKQHGFWLDSGEEARVTKAMQDRLKGQERVAQAESEWSGLLKKLKVRS